MGLFSNKKKPCPICGGATPRLLPDTIEGMPICKECAKKKDMPDQIFEGMTVEKFRQYLTFYQENQAPRDRFQQTFRWNDFSMDLPKKLFRVTNRPEALVMDASCLRGFRILEDSSVLFESGPEGLRSYDSDIPARVLAAAPAIAQFSIEYERYQQMERMRESRKRRGDDRDQPYISEPLFDYPIFQKGFVLELSLEHPYWGGTHSWYTPGPRFDVTYPRTDDFMRAYEREVRPLSELAANLMSLLGGNPAAVRASRGMPYQNAAPVQAAAPAAPAAPAADAVTEIQRYKALLDSGVITEEEFTAKKKQLLGI